jgi:hypothetical protein
MVECRVAGRLQTGCPESTVFRVDTANAKTVSSARQETGCWGGELRWSTRSSTGDWHWGPWRHRCTVVLLRRMIRDAGTDGTVASEIIDRGNWSSRM